MQWLHQSDLESWTEKMKHGDFNAGMGEKGKSSFVGEINVFLLRE